MQYKDRFNRLYRYQYGAIQVWSSYGWQKSAMYSSLDELLCEGRATVVEDSKLIH